MKKVIFFSLFLVLMFSNQWISDFKIIQKKYANAESMELTMVVKLKDKSMKTLESFNSKLIKTKDKYYYKGIDHEIIADTSCKILLLPEEKQIYLFIGRPDELNSEPNEFLTILDSVFSYFGSSMVYSKEENNANKITLKDLNGRFNQIEFVYSTEKQLINKLNLYLSDEIEDKKNKPLATPFVEIEFKNQFFNQKNAGSFISTKKYLTKNKGKYELTDSYKSYKLTIYPFKISQ